MEETFGLPRRAVSDAEGNTVLVDVSQATPRARHFRIDDLRLGVDVEVRDPILEPLPGGDEVGIVLRDHTPARVVRRELPPAVLPPKSG
eukprot:gene9554-4470_t